MDKKVTAMTTIITPQITPYRRQNGVTLPWRIPEMALLHKSLCNGLVTAICRYATVVTSIISNAVVMTALCSNALSVTANAWRYKFGQLVFVTCHCSPIALNLLSLRFLHIATSFPVVTVVLKLYKAIPVMAAVAMRKKVVSIGHFSLSFCLLSLQFFFICLIKSRAIVCIDCTENQRKIGLSQMS